MECIPIESKYPDAIRKVKTALQHLRGLSSCLSSSEEMKASMRAMLDNTPRLQQEDYHILLDTCGNHPYAIWLRYCMVKELVFCLTFFYVCVCVCVCF